MPLSIMNSIARRAVLLGFLACVFPLPSSGQTALSLAASDYAGELGKLHVVLHILQSPERTLRGTLDSVDQGAKGIPCANLVLAGTRLSFEVPAVHGSYAGELSADGKTISGTWSQGSNLPLVFTRRESVSRPPVETAMASTFDFAGKTRTYYSFIPDAAGPLPLVLLLHGSGRNGQVMVDAWKDLASREHFALVAPDAYDSSGWDIKADLPEFLHAAVKQVEAAHSIDTNRIYLFGHSSGAEYALILSILDSHFFAAAAVHAGALPPGYEKLFAYATRRMPVAIWAGNEDPLFPVTAVTATSKMFESNGFPVRLSIIPHHDHNYYAIADEVNRKAWDFLKQAQRHPPNAENQK
jgi:predicted esterase